MMSKDSKIYGIDFGTTTSLLSIGEYANDRISVQTAELSNAFSISSEFYFDGANFTESEVAHSVAIPSLKSWISEAKHDSDLKREVQVGDEGHLVDARVAVSAVLSKIVDLAREKLGISNLCSEKVIFGCPAFWGAFQRKALVEAAKLAGFKNVSMSDLRDEAVVSGVHVIQELLAVQQMELKEKRVLVFDMGGGTLDVALLRLNHSDEESAKKPLSVSVLASDSNLYAGDHADLMIAKLVLDKADKAKLPVPEDYVDENGIIGKTLQRLARTAKEILSSKLEIDVNVGKNAVKISRDDLNLILQDQIWQASELVNKVLIMAEVRDPSYSRLEKKFQKEGVKQNQIKQAIEQNLDNVKERISLSDVKSDLSSLTERVDLIVLSGGMSRVSVFSQFLSDKFKNAEVINAEQDKRFAGESNDHLVVKGLANFGKSIEFNAFRPPVTLTLKGTDGNGEEFEEIVFSAYDSLWESKEFNQDFMIGKQFTFQREVGVKDGTAKLIFSRPGGQVQIDIDDEVLKNKLVSEKQTKNTNAIDIRVGTQPLNIKLYASGLIFVGESNGEEMALVTDWPEVWEGSTLHFQMTRVKVSRLPAGASDWWRNK